VALGAASGCGAARQHAHVQAQGEALRVELAELYVKKGAREAAIPLLRRSLAERPRDAHVRVVYGSLLRDVGLYPQARAQLQIALQLAPAAAEAHAAMGILDDLEGQPAAARVHHERAVALAPAVADYRNNLGFSLYLAGDFDAATAQLEQALALDPGLTVAYNNLGFAYGRRGELDRAERTFRSAGGEVAALMNMAVVHELRGEAAAAAALRERAYDRAPDLRPTEEVIP
jgi:Flp pilus assembly protein TadD